MQNLWLKFCHESVVNMIKICELILKTVLVRTFLDFEKYRFKIFKVL